MHSIRRTITLASALLIVAGALSFFASPPATDLGRVDLAAESVSAWAAGDTMAVRFAGRLKDETPDDNSVFRFTTNMTSLGDGSVLGTMTHEVTCAMGPPPCAMLAATHTFRFKDGEIVNKANEAWLAPDPEDPTWVLIGIHPKGKSVVSGTGAYAGRTGRAHMSGRHDLATLHEGYATFDDFWLIELD